MDVIFEETLDPLEADLLAKPRKGQGGFQDLLDRLNRQRNGLVQQFTAVDAEKVWRYATQYGSGGFEDRLKPLARRIAKRAGLATDG